MHLLIVEDDQKMAALLKRGLEEENHRATVAYDGASAVAFVDSCNFDVIVLDVMLPMLDGLEVARRLRNKHIQTPILMLTARDAVPDITTGLDAGADDYLTKPFAFAELLARIRALARRGPANLSTVLKAGDFTLDPHTHEVKRGCREIKLTATEYRLLELLMRNAGRVISRSMIVTTVWGLEDEIEENTLDAFVSLLRSKINRGTERQPIETVRGFGYRFRGGRK
ncbi:MAG TPA: response regulator transcription factor [Terriglobales bacterium]|nr:response regulator transcription factor [Terriglobales bacterium]